MRPVLKLREPSAPHEAERLARGAVERPRAFVRRLAVKAAIDRMPVAVDLCLMPAPVRDAVAVGHDRTGRVTPLRIELRLSRVGAEPVRYPHGEAKRAHPLE